MDKQYLKEVQEQGLKESNSFKICSINFLSLDLHQSDVP